MALYTRLLFRTYNNFPNMSSLESRISFKMLKLLLPQACNTLKRRLPLYMKTSLFFTVAQCAFPADKSNKLIQAPSPQKLTHEYLITQGCTSTITSAQQLLTLTLSAITDTAKAYRECMEHLMCLMEESLQVQGHQSSQAEIWDEVVAERVKVGECKQKLQNLSSFMEYVDKLATMAAEAAYLGGAEHMSTVMCETINSAHAKLETEYEKTKTTEKELLKQQEIFVHKACEIEKELKIREKAAKVC